MVPDLDANELIAVFISITNKLVQPWPLHRTDLCITGQHP